MSESETNNDINVIIGGISGDEELFFGEPAHKMPFTTTWIDIFTHFNIFKSKSEARKNTKDIEIPWGWSELARGKRKTKFYVLKTNDFENYHNILYEVEDKVLTLEQLLDSSNLHKAYTEIPYVAENI